MVQFGTAGIRGPVDETVTPSVALRVGNAVGRFAVDTAPASPPAVVIGRDGRTTGTTLASAVEAGVSAAGATPIRCGQLPTPALAFASQGRYGVMLTASHNPPTDNGLKCFADGQEFDADSEAWIETAAESETVAGYDAWQSPVRERPLSDYRAAVVEYVQQFADAETPCAALDIAVDCGNGMAALATPQVLTELGAHVIALNGNVDGHFPGRPSKPTPETLGDLQQFVADGTVDLGIAHDGDADRIVILDSNGEIIHEDTVVAILAGQYTRDSIDDATEQATDDPVVVTTPNASARIDETVTAAGGRVERVRLGALHEGIAGVDTGSVVCAAEPWKHIHPAFGGWIDGVVSAAMLAHLTAATGLASLREPITERPYRKVSVDCPDSAKEPAMATLETSLPAAFTEATVSLDHGVRLDCPDGSWLLVRPSGTEPYLRLYAESNAVADLVDTATEPIAAAIDDATERAD